MTLPTISATTTVPIEPERPSAEWWSVEQTAAWLAVAAKLVYKLAHTDKTFPAVKVGGVIRIRRSRLERWLERRHPAQQDSKGSNSPCPRNESPAQLTGSQGET